MKFTRESTAALTIRRVSGTELVVGDQGYSKTIALTHEQVLSDWPGREIADLGENDFSSLLETEAEVILLGTGAENVFPPRELVFAMARRGVGFEAMDTKAAARTFNVLVSEGRRVAAVLYL